MRTLILALALLAASLSADSFCTSMVLNLYIIKGLLCIPTRSCLNSTGPGLVALMAMASASIMGDEIKIPRAEPIISTALFATQFRVLVSGT